MLLKKIQLWYKCNLEVSFSIGILVIIYDYSLAFNYIKSYRPIKVKPVWKIIRTEYFKLSLLMIMTNTFLYLFNISIINFHMKATIIIGILIVFTTT